MPNRIIKESIRTSKTVNSLSDFQFRLWVHLITFVDDYGRGNADIELVKSLVFPRRKSATEAQIKDAMQTLERLGMIVLYEVDGESYFYFPKWTDHQRIQTKHSKFPEPPTGENGEPQKSTVDHGEPPPESESNYNTESKSEYEYESNAHTRTSEIDERFDRFWDEYPRHEKKKDARKAFGALNVTDELLEQMLDAVRRQKASKQWQDAQYIPQPTTWLHGRRWEDEPTKVQKPQGRLDGLKALLEQTEREEQGL